MEFTDVSPTLSLVQQAERSVRLEAISWYMKKVYYIVGFFF